MTKLINEFPNKSLKKRKAIFRSRISNSLERIILNISRSDQLSDERSKRLAIMMADESYRKNLVGKLTEIVEETVVEKLDYILGDAEASNMSQDQIVDQIMINFREPSI